MSKEIAGKVGLIILCIAIAVFSVIGILVGILYMAFSGDNGWIALIVGSGVAFIGAIFGIFYVSFKKKTLKEKEVKKTKRSNKETIIWLSVTIVSGAGAVSTYFLGRMQFTRTFNLMLSLIVILGAVCLFSLFVLISGKSIRSEKITDFVAPTDIEDSIDG